jgi:hypothetical protein
MSFVGKDDTTLCKQMKFMFKRAYPGGGEESFIGHMEHDNGLIQFIETGFIGKKGMTDKDVKAEPPPGWTQAKMVQLSKNWVEAMGGRFHGDEDCGCVKQQYALRLNYLQILNINFGLINGQDTTNTGAQNSQGLEIPLDITQPGAFKGEGVMTLKGRGQYGTVVGNCSGQSEQSFLVRATAQLEEGDEESRGKDNKLHVRFQCDQMHLQSSGQCAGRGASESRFTSCDASNVTVDFVPANVDSTDTKAFPTPVPNSQSSLTTTIVKKQ